MALIDSTHFERYFKEGLLPSPQLEKLISKVEQLPWELTASEKKYFAANSGGSFPFLVSPHYLALATDREDDPIRRQIIPRAAELTGKTYELRDPLGEEKYQPTPRLIHRYPSRALLLVNDSCATYCRHCFRRYFSGTANGSISPGQLRQATIYLANNPNIKELLLSGGDPMLLSNQRLYGIFREIRTQLPNLVLRIATRTPVVMPARFDDLTIKLLSSIHPVWIVTHFNHSQEIAPSTAKILTKMVDNGLPILNQTVLLAGVNDDVDVLQNLMENLVQLRVKPYYLFQGDLARGTAHLRVPLAKGLQLVNKLRRKLSGLAMPNYAVDLPGGGGKVLLADNPIVGKDDSDWLIRSSDGQIFRYPQE